MLGRSTPPPSIATGTKVVLAAATVILCLIGVGLGLRVWNEASPEHAVLEPAAPLPATPGYIDWLYAQIIEKPGAALSNFSAYVIDKKIIDGGVNGIAVLVRDSGRQLRKLQTGYVRNYALGIAAGTVLVLAYVVVRAR